MKFGWLCAVHGGGVDPQRQSIPLIEYEYRDRDNFVLVHSNSQLILRIVY